MIIENLVTIGMSIYNEQEYIIETLNSLLAQDYPHLEIIIIDNSSTDRSPTICQNYALHDPRIHYYRNQTPQDYITNTKQILAQAQGEYYLSATGHDWWHPQFISHCLAPMIQDESVVLCYPQIIRIDRLGQPIPTTNEILDTRGLGLIDRFNLTIWGLNHNYPLHGILRLKILRSINYPQVSINPSQLLLMEMSALGAFAYLPETLFYLREISPDLNITDQLLPVQSSTNLLWQFIDENLKLVAKYIPSEQQVTTRLSLISCIFSKYHTIIENLQHQANDTTETNHQSLKVLHNYCHQWSNIIRSFFSPTNQKTTPLIILDGVFFQLYKTGIARVWTSVLQEWVATGFAQHIILLDRANTAPQIPGIYYLTIPPYDYQDTEGDREMLQIICDQQQVDLFISTYYTTPKTTPSVFMGYDMIPEVLGANLDEPMWQEKHYGIHHASSYITISHNTAHDLKQFFPSIDPNLITVAHCGVSPYFCPAPPQDIELFIEKYGITKPYFMLTSIEVNYKNAILFFQAFAQLTDRHQYAILCTGSGFPLSEEFQLYTQGIEVHTIRLSDSELPVAYSGAIALVYPSLYEGFGLPVLEALACGCPVITTSLSSIPEVAAGAAYYINPNSIPEMVQALIQIQKKHIRQSLIETGLEQGAKFSWSRMAQTISFALVKASLHYLNLQLYNYIIYPDWNQDEEILSNQIAQEILKLSDQPQLNQTTLLIYRGNFPQEEANLIVSSVFIELYMEYETLANLTIELLGELSDLQWSVLNHLIIAEDFPLDNQSK